jgi:tRNA 2-thiocytidine biosynthesis protein TtcA
MSRYSALQIRKLMGRAISRWTMIEDGDHVLVAVSGGKDSMTLLWNLRERITRIPINYTLTAIHVNPGFNNHSYREVESFFIENNFNYRIIHSNLGEIAHSEENRENPCFLCSRIRRKLIFQTSAEMGCTKIAFAHHKDDVIETFFINVLYGASISTMKPVQEFFNGRLRIIRPLYMVDEETIKRYVSHMGWKPVDLGCPTSGITKRQEIKDMLSSIYRKNKKVKGNIFHALQNVRKDYLP